MNIFMIINHEYVHTWLHANVDGWSKANKDIETEVAYVAEEKEERTKLKEDVNRILDGSGSLNMKSI